MSKPLSRSAYPVDDAALRARRRRLALCSPITWIPYVMLAAIAYFTPIPWWGIAALALVITLALIVYWTKRIGRVDARITRELLEEVDAEQDDELVQTIQRLEKSGHEQYGVTLGRFLKLKKAIEKILRSDNDVLRPFSEEMETLVDSLCLGVAEELESLGRVQERLARPRAGIAKEDQERLTETQRDLVGKISSAFKTLTDCEHRLLDTLHPVMAPTERPSRLDDIVEKLREETDLVKRVQQRLTDSNRDLAD